VFELPFGSPGPAERALSDAHREAPRTAGRKSPSVCADWPDPWIDEPDGAVADLRLIGERLSQASRSLPRPEAPFRAKAAEALALLKSAEWPAADR
jgi:hypothetical protein